MKKKIIMTGSNLLGSEIAKKLAQNISSGNTVKCKESCGWINGYRPPCYMNKTLKCKDCGHRKQDE